VLKRLAAEEEEALDLRETELGAGG
jgi:hypothetical protein